MQHSEELLAFILDRTMDLFEKEMDALSRKKKRHKNTNIPHY
jgi:hypothetical protein